MSDVELLSIRVADLEFALELAAVKEVIRPPSIVRVPNLPPFVSGVINFRNVAIPVIDLQARFQSKSAILTQKQARLVICAVGTKVIAFAVDGASEIVRVASENVLPASDASLRAVVSGVVPYKERLLVWLDAQGLLSSEELLSLDSFRMQKEDLQT